MHALPNILTTYQDYENYWENIAEGNRLIGHEAANLKRKRFFVDPELVSGPNITGTILTLVNHPINYGGETMDNIIEQYNFEFMVLQAVGTKSNEQKTKQAVANCNVIYKQIIARLIYDSAPDVTKARYFCYFRMTETAKEIINYPILGGDGWSGIGGRVRMGNQEIFDYNANDWI